MSEEKPFIVKQYPLRYHDIEKYRKELREVCSCGHEWCMHDDKIGCGDCTCPKFEFQQKLTLDQILELSFQIQKDAKQKGFTQ